MQKIVLTFGLIAGAILAATMLVAFAFQDRIGFERGMVIGYTAMVAAFLMVFFGVKSYRDTVAGGRVSFGRAFAVGLAITLVASACYVATWEFVYYGLAPDFGDKYASYAIEQAKKAGASDAELAGKKRDMEAFAASYRNPFYNVAMTLLEPLPVGVAFTLVSAAVLSRRRRDAVVPA